MRTAFRVAYAVILSLLVLSCRSTKETAYSGHERTEIRTVHDTIRDSVQTAVERVIRDSVIVRQKGDTVYVDRWHVRSNTGNSFVKTRWSVAKTDTVIKRDTAYIQRVVQPSASIGNRIERGIIYVFAVLSLVFVILMLIAFRAYRRRNRN